MSRPIRLTAAQTKRFAELRTALEVWGEHEITEEPVLIKYVQFQLSKSPTWSLIDLTGATEKTMTFLGCNAAEALIALERIINTQASTTPQHHDCLEMLTFTVVYSGQCITIPAYTEADARQYALELFRANGKRLLTLDAVERLVQADDLTIIKQPTTPSLPKVMHVRFLEIIASDIADLIKRKADKPLLKVNLRVLRGLISSLALAYADQTCERSQYFSPQLEQLRSLLPRTIDYKNDWLAGLLDAQQFVDLELSQIQE